MSRRSRLAHRTTLRLGSAAVFVALSAAALPASAAPCDMSTGDILYIAGPDSMINVLRNVAASLWSEDVKIFYKGYPSCLGIQNLVNNEPTTPDPAEIGTLAAHQVSFWPVDPDVEELCELPFDDLDPDEPEIIPDIVLSDVFATTCADFPNGLGTVADFQGPVLGFGFIVHPDSPAVSISAEAAYLVYGFGAESNVVAPWTDPLTILHRDENSGAENVFAKTIGLDVTKFAGMSLNSTGTLVTQVASATGADVNTTIGGANVGIIDSRRGEIRALAYQHYDQTCGYYPDSSLDAFDKRNIRDGHYPIWGAIHIYTRVDEAGIPINAGANRFINLTLGTDEIEGLDPIALEATSNLIPQCAMTVARTEDGGPLSSSLPPRPCGCYFESLTGGTDCEACMSSAECPAEAPECSYGYCEP
ncbi:MAG: hypothetical protein IPM79_04140 [Polyangiaceae bacterium]|jgi:hypothetical protein|nr:hypothetical protein [Polyangiaceae bacterium]MBK8936847.1 hypothetical protein [Polyangiaceae bacterium]